MAERLSFALDPNQIAIRNILSNKSFIEIEVYAISNADPNRNRSCFLLKSMEEGIHTFTDKPILGFFNVSGDFEQHNGKNAYDAELNMEYWDNSKGEQILGFIREKDQKEIVERDGLSWIRCTAMICTRYNFKQVKRLLKDRKKKVITKFELLGITILGSKGGIPIKEGIPGAQLSVLDLIDKEPLNQQRQALAFAYAELNKEEDTSLAKEDIGTKGDLKVNKSKEAMSDTAWGEVDKTALRSRVVEAENFKTVAKDVFLDLREGWEDGEVSKMKYPVMQLKEGDEVVYNRGGLASAKGYAEKNGDEEVIKKLKAIYEDLGLDYSDNEQECDCSQFCDLYEDDDNDEDDKKSEPDEGKDGHGDDEGHGDDDGDDKKDGGEDDKKDDDEKDVQHQAEDGSEETKDKVDEEPAKDFKAECDELQMKCNEYEQRCCDYEARCAEYEQKCADYEATIAKCNENLSRCTADYEEAKKECEGFRAELEALKQKEKDKVRDEQICHLNKLSQHMGLSAEEVKCVSEKCSQYAFASLEEIDKEVAYIAWKKNFSDAAQDHFAVNITESTPSAQPSREKMSTAERLKKNIHK